MIDFIMFQIECAFYYLQLNRLRLEVIFAVAIALGLVGLWYMGQFI